MAALFGQPRGEANEVYPEDDSPLAQKFREVAARDRRCDIFGASVHRYKTRRVTEREIAEFEEWCGCPLPEDYRNLIRSIGLGAGPYYGLLDFPKIKESMAGMLKELPAQAGRSCLSADPFPLEAKILDLRNSGIVTFGLIEVQDFAHGFLPICELGCEYVAILVTAGKCRGMVFEVDNDASLAMHCIPATRPPGKVMRDRHEESLSPFPRFPTFAEWVGAWHEISMRDLGGTN